MSARVKVMMDRCETCIYRLRYPQETRERVIGGAARAGTFVACHTAADDGDGATICAGFHRAQPFATPSQRLGAMLNRVEYVDEEGEAVACPYPQKGRAR